MSKSGTIETRSTSESFQAWRREIEQWHASLQHFLAETLSEIRGLIEVIESDVPAELVAPPAPPAKATRPAPIPQPSPARPVVQPAKPPSSTYSEPAHPQRTAAREEDARAAAPTQPTKASGGGAPEDRLAQLARLLEEKLERSGSRTSNE